MPDTPDLLDRPDHADMAFNPIALALDLADDGEMRIRLEALHPADFSDYFEALTDGQREALVGRAPELITGELLAELEDEVVEDVLPLLEPDLIADALTELDSDDVTQIMEEMDAAQRRTVLDAMAPTERAGVEASLAFDDETIGRLMQREFVSAPEFWTVGDTIDHMREAGEELPDLFFNIYIVDPRLKPIGYVPVSKLMRAARDTTLSSLMIDVIRTIDQSLDQEEAAYLFEKYHLISAPVVDGQGRIVGMMTVDDILDIIQDENKEDILALAGVSEAGITDTALETVKSRAPWLLVNLATAILASLVIARFDYAIEQIVALAVLMPIVASMGGNAGTQALTVAVRSLAERDLTSATAWRAVRREGVSALIIGLIFAVAMAGIAFVWFGDARLAGVAFVAMIINHVFAGLAGILIPLGLKRAGADPAVSSSVFVTTVTDVVGFTAFLGFAALILL
ncbi:magnesium transporter [uncultured Algimonas sp.]|uniref:magnesium transporter n=1 Tax=uncultured Algimonas sp. TaxID=1547920 RepID=UPI0026399FAC|nr:magnesium transporter [uncultured Algimonas sp.]